MFSNATLTIAAALYALCAVVVLLMAYLVIRRPRLAVWCGLLAAVACLWAWPSLVLAQTTTAADTSLSLGTLGAQILAWVVAAFGTVLGTVATIWLTRLAKKAGVEVTQQMSDQLDRTLVNGLNDAATKIGAGIQGQWDVKVKNQIVQGAIEYAQQHRADTIQALGLNPQSGAAVEALRARIATLVTDPTVPTPPKLDPPKPQ